LALDIFEIVYRDEIIAILVKYTNNYITGLHVGKTDAKIATALKT